MIWVCSLIQLPTSPSIPKKKQISRPAKRGQVGKVLENIYEKSTINLATTGVGAYSGTIAIGSPAGLISAGRLAGYQALRDDIRLDRVKMTFTPYYRGTSRGLVAAYIERVPTEAVSATLTLASDQLECKTVALSEGFSLSWSPQQPSDREFQPLNPGTVALFDLDCVGSGLEGNGVALPSGTAFMWVTVETWSTLRGRAN